MFKVWSVVDRYVRKITKNNGARQINVPRSIQNIIAGNDVQWVILKNGESRMIALCGIDDFNILLDNINKDGE